MDDQAFQEFHRQLTSEFQLRLLLHARKRARRYGWYSSKTSDTALPRGESIDGIVSRVIEKVLSGDNPWDPQAVGLDRFLWQNIKRELDHLNKHRDNRKRMRLSDDISTESAEAELQGSLEATGMRPSDILSDSELNRLQSDLVARIYCSLGDDPILAQILELTESGVKRGEIAEKLGISPKDFDNARKRLLRRIQEFEPEARKILSSD